MTQPASDFVWYDVMTTDITAAAAFYADVVGWTTKDSGMPGDPYLLLLDGETMVGGIMKAPEGVPPGWMGYVGVPDIHAKLEALVAAGGTVHRPATDIPGVGRFAVVADPDGAGFMLFQPIDGREAAPKVAPMQPRRVGWHELHAGSLDRAWPFYAGLFGWTKGEGHDMGGFVYQTFATGDAGTNGGMMTKMPSTPVPHWAYYIAVPDFDAAVARAERGGATLLMQPMQVPGGTWICPAKDPQGAHFHLIGERS